MSRETTYSMDNASILRSPQERKETLRKMITTTESLQQAVSDTTINTLETCMEQTDIINSETTLEEKVHNQEEVLLDSEMMSLSSKVLKQCTRSLTKYMCSYNSVEFAKTVAKHVKQLPGIESNTTDWSLLENKVTKYFKTMPQYSTLLGTLAPLERKEIVRRKPAVREAQAQIKRPENVVAVDKEEVGLEQTVKMKSFITRYYKAHREPLDFFKLILHPADFGKTIENILQISFLVRDGNIKITKDSSGILVVQPCTKDMIAQTGKTPNIQNVVYLNMDQWRMLKDVYRLEKPMIDFNSVQ